MGDALGFIGTIGQWERLNWWGQNFLRRSAEYIEWQLKQLPAPKELGWEGPPSWLEALSIWIVRGMGLALGLLLLWLVIKRLWPWYQQWHRASQPATEVTQQTLEPTLSTAEWLLRAERAKNQQDYAQACRALYMALLLRLDSAGWLPRDAARTNQEYLQRLNALWALEQQPTAIYQAWRQIFQVHDQSYYGQQPIAVETFHQCQRAYQTLELALEQRPTQADP